MDGVLLDSEPTHAQAWINTYQEQGITITGDYYFSNLSGKHGLDSTKLVLEANNQQYTQAKAAALVLRKDQLAANLLKNTATPVKDVVEKVKELSKTHKLGLGSTSSMIVVHTILTKFDLDDQFNVTISGEGVSQGKPHPEVYEKIARLLEEDPSNCVVIEDSKSGIMAAKSAGMKCIAIFNRRNKKEDLVNADKVITSFEELTAEVIEQL